jgi:hypothetical protein
MIVSAEAIDSEHFCTNGRHFGYFYVAASKSGEECGIADARNLTQLNR